MPFKNPTKFKKKDKEYKRNKYRELYAQGLTCRGTLRKYPIERIKFGAVQTGKTDAQLDAESLKWLEGMNGTNNL